MFHLKINIYLHLNLEISKVFNMNNFGLKLDEALLKNDWHKHITGITDWGIVVWNKIKIKMMNLWLDDWFSLILSGLSSPFLLGDFNGVLFGRFFVVLWFITRALWPVVIVGSAVFQTISWSNPWWWCYSSRY